MDFKGFKIVMDLNVKTTNKIIFDWLTFSIKDADFDYIVELLGLPCLNWQAQRGRYCYRDMFYYDGIAIMYNGINEKMGWCVEMSGSGCRTFETYSSRSIRQVIYDIVTNNIECETYASENNCSVVKQFNITRVDIALDMFDNQLNLNTLISDVHNNNFVSVFKKNSITIEEHQGHIGQTVYFGSSKSKTRFRIYDKKYQLNVPDSEMVYWVRFEIQLRHENAYTFCTQFVFGDLTIGQMFSGVVNNYLRIIEPNQNDTNKRRNKSMRKYWLKMINTTIEPIKLYTHVNQEYNLDRTKKYVYNQSSNSIECVINNMGVYGFLKEMKANKPKYSEKYETIQTNTNKIQEFLDFYENNVAVINTAEFEDI